MDNLKFKKIMQTYRISIPISKGFKLYIDKLIKRKKVTFESWKSGFGFRCTFDENSYPTENKTVTFGGSKYQLKFKDNPNFKDIPKQIDILKIL